MRLTLAFCNTVAEMAYDTSCRAPARAKRWQPRRRADVMMMNKRCRRDASGLCRCESTHEEKVCDDDIGWMAREFDLHIVRPDGRGQEPAGDENVDRECLGCPSPYKALRGRDTGERVMRLVKRHQRGPDGPDAIEEAGTSRAWRAVRLKARASENTDTMSVCNQLLRHGKDRRNVSTSLKHGKEKSDRSRMRRRGCIYSHSSPYATTCACVHDAPCIPLVAVRRWFSVAMVMKCESRVFSSVPES